MYMGWIDGHTRQNFPRFLILIITRQYFSTQFCVFWNFKFDFRGLSRITYFVPIMYLNMLEAQSKLTR